MSGTATILRLRITGFRGLKKFDWLPKAGMNVILGGGDVGKTTILDALALLLSPSNTTTIVESDYWQRDSNTEFEIEATVDLPDTVEFEKQTKMTWPWNWNGKEAVAPVDTEGSEVEAETPVYVIRVRGTKDLELVWEVLQPNGDANHLSVGVRRNIGLVRLSSDERNDRDLRLVYGSALDRLLADTGLRARIGRKMASVPVLDGEEKPKEVLAALEIKMAKNALPVGLKLGLTSSQGLSIGSLIGIMALHDGVDLPLSNWGAGTRRMAALEVAAATVSHASITTIDEIERGLEPYRLRKLLTILEETSGQVFLTTHSAVAISCVSLKGNLWYLDGTGNIGPLPSDKIGEQQKRDPETFLAKLAVVGEGETEVGFLHFILRKAFNGDPLDHGVRVCDGQGNNHVLGLLQTLSGANLAFAALVDDEGKDTGSWAALKTKMGDRLHQWKNGCTESHVIGAIPDDKMALLLTNDEDNRTSYRLRTLAQRLNINSKELPDIVAALQKEKKSLKALIIEAATGSIASLPADAEKGTDKTWKKHAKDWFKSLEGGEELAKKAAACGAWPEIEKALLPLVNSIRADAKLSKITGITL